MLYCGDANKLHRRGYCTEGRKKLLSKILKVLVPGIALFVIYLCLWKVAESYFYRGDYNDYLFCFSMSAVVTPIYYFACMKLVGFDLERGTDYIIQTVIFSQAVVLYSFLWPIRNQSGYMDFEFILRPLRFLFMYFIGNSVYVIVYHVIAAIRERMYGDILRKSVSAVLVFVLYCFLSEEILPDIGGIFVLIVSTVICHWISKSILRVRYENFSGYIFELSVLVCGIFLRNIIYGPDLYYEMSDIIRIFIIYAFANGINYAIDYVVTNTQKSGSRGKVQDEQYEKEDRKNV